MPRIIATNVNTYQTTTFKTFCIGPITSACMSFGTDYILVSGRDGNGLTICLQLKNPPHSLPLPGFTAGIPLVAHCVLADYFPGFSRRSSRRFYWVSISAYSSSWTSFLLAVQTNFCRLSCFSQSHGFYSEWYRSSSVTPPSCRALPVYPVTVAVLQALEYVRCQPSWSPRCLVLSAWPSPFITPKAFCLPQRWPLDYPCSGATQLLSQKKT